jgi:hypothetical protein
MQKPAKKMNGLSSGGRSMKVKNALRMIRTGGGWLFIPVIVSLLLLGLAGGPALAEEDQAGDQETEKQEEEHDFLERPIGDNWILSPVVLPIVSPESGFGLALGGLATFSTNPEYEEMPRSTITVVAVPTTSGLGFNGDLESFWAGDFVRAVIELDLDMGVDNYWGTGYEAGREVEEDEDVTEFERDVFEMPVIVGFRLVESMYLGVNFDLISMKVDERSPTQEEDEHYLTYGDEILNVGLGLKFLWDTRDDTVNAYSGRFFSMEGTFYRDGLGSDQEFERYALDYRQYHQIKRPGRTIAWQVAGSRAYGDVPWVRMSTIGSSRDLRGYTQGRFRDNAVAWAQVEYRHMTNKKLFKLGRQGFAVWAGIGFIGEDFGDFGSHELPNAGIGYRLEIQPRRNLRLDLGVGYDEIGLYFNFAEAF